MINLLQLVVRIWHLTKYKHLTFKQIIHNLKTLKNILLVNSENYYLNPDDFNQFKFYMHKIIGKYKRLVFK